MSCVTRPTKPCRQTAQPSLTTASLAQAQDLVQRAHDAAVSSRQILWLEHSIPPRQEIIGQLKLPCQCDCG